VNLLFCTSLANKKNIKLFKNNLFNKKAENYRVGTLRILSKFEMTEGIYIQ